MTVQEAIATRRSIRAFEPRAVEEDKLRAVLEAARLAPSARNSQTWKFILVRDKELMKKMLEAADNQPSVASAPAVLVAVGTSDYVMTCGQHAGSVDLSIAMSYMQLRAHELGLGTCWLGRFFADKVKAALNIPADCTVVAISPIGYPAETPEPRPRKAFGEVVSFDGF